ncbi:PEP-CTERM sorting domain-containing protein [Laspinema sp. A4]|uniref:PEP-CTERM sorting domain-containing protein n=1 Tax=Laspinema sp. D2d TaxID=2953686 RepID=UPI0021BB552C|nr:PEP-CTERM sorting domain-containing protein [Laspinema sp. D2d]MCT7986323.1 PEP-CTERM sorting domain-containing protein [Laspinema sp. D2d]
MMAASAVAAPTAGTCSITDVLLGNTPATACEGAFEGNDTGAQSTLLGDLNGGMFSSFVDAGTTWTLGAKSDDAGSWLLAENGTTDSNKPYNGEWNLLNAISGGTFVLSLKSNTYYSAYLFQGIDFATTGLEGLFNTIGVAVNKGRGQDLSHASIFVASGGPIVDPTPVPEPATLLGLAVVGGGLSLRRRKSASC